MLFESFWNYSGEQLLDFMQFECSEPDCKEILKLIFHLNYYADIMIYNDFCVIELETC